MPNRMQEQMAMPDDERKIVSKVPEHISAPNYAIILERLVRDVSIPIERLNEAQKFIERQQEQERSAALMIALAQAQQDMEPIKRDLPNEQTKSRYASLAALDRAIREHYTKHGLAPTFNTRSSPKGEFWITVVADLVHTSGGHREYSIDMLADGAGPKGSPVMTRTHAIGSAVTYGKRQLLKMIFNLAEAGEDDDGNAAGARDFLTAEELDHIGSALEDAGAESTDVARFLKTMKIEGLSQLRREQAAEAMQRIANFKANKLRRKATGFEDAATNP